MNVTVTGNGGDTFHWNIPVSPIQDGPVTGDGVTNLDNLLTLLATAGELTPTRIQTGV